MYLLYYSPEEQKYNLEFARREAIQAISNCMDVIYEFESSESHIATKVLKNLNTALRQAA